MNRMVKASVDLETRRRELGVLLDASEDEQRMEGFEGRVEAAKVAISTAQTTQATAALAEPEIREKRETTEDGEGAELRNMKAKASFGQYVAASGARRGVLGVENELNQALGLGELDFPLDMLAPPEKRAAIDGDADTNSASWLDRLFATSAATYLGVSMRSVAAGIASYPVTSTGPTGQQRQRSEAASAVAVTVSVTELKPTRHATHVIYNIEDVARLPGLADAIRRDMAEALVDNLDKAVFTGAGAGGTEADIAGFNTATISESTLTQTNKVKADKVFAEFVAQIDGKYASGPGDLKVVLAVGAAKLWLETIHAASVDNQTIAQFLRDNGLSWTIRGDIESNTANNDFGAFMGLARGIEGAAVMPVWLNANLITDPYTSAAKGEVQLTMNALWNFGIPRGANFKRLKFVT